MYNSVIKNSITNFYYVWISFISNPLNRIEADLSAIRGERRGDKMGYSYDKLRGKIIEKYGSQEKYAEVLGISTNSLSKKMTGKTGFSQKDIVVWSELLEIDKSDYSEYFFA